MCFHFVARFPETNKLQSLRIQKFPLWLLMPMRSQINPVLLLESSRTQSNSTRTEITTSSFFICPLQPFAAAKGILNLEESCLALSCVICPLPRLALGGLEGRRGSSNSQDHEERGRHRCHKTDGRLLLHSLGRPQGVTDDEVWLRTAA